MRLLELTAAQTSPVVISLEGGVVVKFTTHPTLQPDNESPPIRDGNIIYVPPVRANEFFELGSKKHLLFKHHSGKRNSLTFWFCGFDEAPFLTEITEATFCNYLHGSEEEFFDGLKPAEIKACERIFDVKSKRQGDIWFCPLGDTTWEQLLLVHKLNTGLETLVTQLDPPNSQVFGTRHTFEGKWVSLAILGLKKVTLASGTMQAPDHKTVTFEAPHVIAQSAGLMNRNGD